MVLCIGAILIFANITIVAIDYHTVFSARFNMVVNRLRALWQLKTTGMKAVKAHTMAEQLQGTKKRAADGSLSPVLMR